jgi:thiamine-phosphate pyrophosphorylase
VTDPERTPDPVAITRGLPRGAAVIYRAFARPEAATVARELALLARRRGLLLLIGADERLAAAVGAHGLHLPERMIGRAPGLRARRPGWLITAAAHSSWALQRAERAGADAVLLSSAFESRSPSARSALGAVRFALLARSVQTPVVALGGVNGRNAARLVGAGAAGLAAVDAWLD